jgi:recombination protein RecR
MKIPKAIQNLIDAFERLPGIGSKTAARLTFYLLHVPEAERERLGNAVSELGRETILCKQCFNITDASSATDRDGLCEICSDSNRDRSLLCVIEDPLDLLAFEKTGKYNGLYHVLHGVIAPLEHIGPEDLKIDELVGRVKASFAKASGDKTIKEIVLATNPSLEGEATAMYIRQLISKQPTGNSGKIKITRIARGIPTGGDLEYADEVTLTKALEGRQDY